MKRTTKGTIALVLLAAMAGSYAFADKRPVSGSAITYINLNDDDEDELLKKKKSASTRAEPNAPKVGQTGVKPNNPSANPNPQGHKDKDKIKPEEKNPCKPAVEKPAAKPTEKKPEPVKPACPAKPTATKPAAPKPAAPKPVAKPAAKPAEKPGEKKPSAPQVYVPVQPPKDSGVVVVGKRPVTEKKPSSKDDDDEIIRLRKRNLRKRNLGLKIFIQL